MFGTVAGAVLMPHEWHCVDYEHPRVLVSLGTTDTPSAGRSACRSGTLARIWGLTLCGASWPIAIVVAAMSLVSMVTSALVVTSIAIVVTAFR